MILRRSITPRDGVRVIGVPALPRMKAAKLPVDLIWIVAFTICTVLILAPSRERDRQAIGFQAGTSAATRS